LEIRIATRKSELALWQAKYVAQKLEGLPQRPDVTLVPLSTRGDEILDKSLQKIGGKGLFIKELEVAMQEGAADIAVHSMKDVPAEMPDGSNPKQAEEAVEDLADLMRANLNSTGERTTLKQELETAAIYQRIEKLRLGDRLRVKWNVAELPMRALIPGLTIQPLLENAIYHGIELLPEGGEVTVSGKRVDDVLDIRISNPIAADQSRKTGGNKMAMSNIRQRFELAYGHQAMVDVQESDNEYSVQLRFPYSEAGQ